MEPLLFYRRVSDGSSVPSGTGKSTLCTWGNFSPEAYESTEDPLTKSKVISYKGGPGQYWPALTANSFSKGRHFIEVHVSCDNMWVGVACPSVPLNKPLGTTADAWAVDLQTGHCFTGASYSDTARPRRTGGVVSELTKLVTPISGGRCGIYLDMEEGVIAFFLNGEYQGIMNPGKSIAGKTVHVAVAIGGLEGKKAALPSVPAAIPAVRPCGFASLYITSGAQVSIVHFLVVLDLHWTVTYRAVCPLFPTSGVPVQAEQDLVLP